MFKRFTLNPQPATVAVHGGDSHLSPQNVRLFFIFVNIWACPTHSHFAIVNFFLVETLISTPEDL